MFLAISQPILDRFLWFKDRQLGKNVVSKVQHMTGRKTGCNRSRPVFFGFSTFRQMLQLATEKIQNLCNRNRWSGLLQSGSVRFRSFFQSSELDLRTLEEAIEWVYLSYRRGPGGGSLSMEETDHWGRRQCSLRKETVHWAQRSFIDVIPVIEGGHQSFREKTICWGRRSAEGGSLSLREGAIHQGREEAFCQGGYSLPNTWEDTLHWERRPPVEGGRWPFIAGGRRPCVVVWIGPCMGVVGRKNLGGSY